MANRYSTTNMAIGDFIALLFEMNNELDKLGAPNI
jgi:hypothetical protein